MIPESHSTTLYTLGKGIISIAEWSGGTIGAYSDVGNCPKFDVEVTESTLDHFSSRTGAKVKDAIVTIETGYTLTFDLDEMSVKNMAMYIKGTMSGVNVILANTAMAKEYSIKFVSDNPWGPNEKWEFWKARLTPNGAFSLIGDEWSKLSFKGEGLADEVLHATSPYFTVTYATTTSTTTTTTS